MLPACLSKPAMAQKASTPGCVGAAGFDPAASVRDPGLRTATLALLDDQDDFAGAISTYFRIPASDNYVYHAITSVTLPQVQHIVRLGGANRLHAWYAAAVAAAGPDHHPQDTSTPPLDPPPRQDVDAYTSIFAPHTLTSSALKALGANAKKGSLRSSVAAHLLHRRYIHPSPAARHLHIPKQKKDKATSPAAAGPLQNPYLDFWAWSCRNLEWCGPCPEAQRPAGAHQSSHHVLPVLMHHFGCAVPSYEALEVLRLVADGRTVADVGSGNGYWTFMLRQHGVGVVPVDNAQSAWRVNWVGDTTIADGTRWLSKNAGGKDVVLLMVYPVVGGGMAGGVEGGFTRELMKTYRGDTVAVAGTQNHNGYTSFKNMTFDEYMAREQPDWTKVVQIPLPSFAGKDEALFIYQRGDRAAKLKAAEVGDP